MITEMYTKNFKSVASLEIVLKIILFFTNEFLREKVTFAYKKFKF